MASGDKHLKIVCDICTFDSKTESLSGKAEPRKVNGKEIEMKTDGSPVIHRKNSKGNDLVFCKVKNGQPLLDASGKKEELGNGYMDSNNQLATDVVPYYKALNGDTIPATKNEKTEVFEITKWEPSTNFTDKYIVDKYYQVKPAQGKSKKDFQRLACINANTREMKKVWDYMTKEEVVGRGILNISSAGYLPTIAYLRPVSLGSHWTIEIGIFKQQKRYTWLEEKDFKPREVEVTNATQAIPSIDEI